jgi:ferritin-like metal-binding protein YciE
MPKQKTLSDAFYETLKDVYYAEKQSVRALKKAAKQAQSTELKQAFDTHRTESEQQVERLQQVFELIGKPARAKTCEAMQGLTSEMDEDLEDFGDTEAADHVLIACAQAVEHYEIARYGTLKSWAGMLGLTEAATLLDATLQEEKQTDEKLTMLAEASGHEEDDEDDAEEDEEQEDEEDKAA